MFAFEVRPSKLQRNTGIFQYRRMKPEQVAFPVMAIHAESAPDYAY
jgi:hypothetical protein